MKIRGKKFFSANADCDMKKKILFLVLSSYTDVYKNSKITVGVPKLPLLSIGLLLRIAENAGAESRLFDMSIASDNNQLSELKIALDEFNPDIVGFGFTTTLYREAFETCAFIKKEKNKTVIICGGVHPSLFPEDILTNFPVDIVFIGESEKNLYQYLTEKNLVDIQGIAYKSNEKIITQNNVEYSSKIDDLPFPAWEHFDLKKYYYPKINVHQPPALPIITSLGCPYSCNFCTKIIHGGRFRMMSPERVISEIEYLKKIGAGEFHIWDDQFTTDLPRAKRICELLIKREIKMKWNIFIGVRVNSIDREFLSLAKKSGLYQIAYAPESGSQIILDEIKKNITLEDSITTFEMTHKLGLETVAFFVIGFLNETQETIKQTINFAKKLNPDFAKVTIALPLPKTKFYNELLSKNLINSFDWQLYNFHLKHQVWSHPVLTWDDLYDAYNRFYSSYYFRLEYIFKAFKRSLKNGNLLFEITGAFKTFLSR